MLARRQIQASHSSVGWWEARDNGHKLKQGKLKVDMKHSNRLPVEAVLYPYLEIFKTRLDKALSNLSCDTADSTVSSRVFDCLMILWKWDSLHPKGQPGPRACCSK